MADHGLERGQAFLDSLAKNAPSESTQSRANGAIVTLPYPKFEAATALRLTPVCVSLGELLAKIIPPRAPMLLRIPVKTATDSDSNPPPVPVQTHQRFQSKPATHSN